MATSLFPRSQVLDVSRKPDWRAVAWIAGAVAVVAASLLAPEPTPPPDPGPAAFVAAHGHYIAIAPGVPHAFRWTQSDGMKDLGAPPGARPDSTATGVSADGSVVVSGAELARELAQVDEERWRGSPPP